MSHLIERFRLFLARIKARITQNKHVLYLKSVCRHKWYVFLACRTMNVPLAWSILHDWDKFFPRMWFPYANYFSPENQRRKKDGTFDRKPEGELDFDIAWNGHQKLNKHHYQYWILIEDSGKVQRLPMPDRHRREMIADWMGAGRAYNLHWTPLELLHWYQDPARCDDWPNRLHLETQRWVEDQITKIVATYRIEEEARRLKT